MLSEETRQPFPFGGAAVVTRLIRPRLVAEAIIALTLLTSSPKFCAYARAQAVSGDLGTVTFENASGTDSMVRVTGPSAQEFQVPSGQSVTITVSAGDYYFIGRYGRSLSEFIYDKAGPVTINQQRAIKITLHRPRADNAAARREFESGRNSAPPPSQTEPVKPADNLSTVLIKSIPDGADIRVDGKYVGMTTSTIRLDPGDHAIRVEKAGLRPWERTVTLTAGGNATLEAQLGLVVPLEPGASEVKGGAGLSGRFGGRLAGTKWIGRIANSGLLKESKHIDEQQA